MSCRIRLFNLAELATGKMLPLELDGMPPLAAFNVDGEIFVTSNVCTHNVATLTEGYFEGTIVECPMHGGCFDVTTGQATAFPCEKSLQTYPIDIEDGVVYLAENSPASSSVAAHAGVQGVFND